jgi:hypothetical protein
VAGALLEAELATVVAAAGFEGFAIGSRCDVYEGAPQHSWAAEFGTVGIDFTATKRGARR